MAYFQSPTVQGATTNFELATNLLRARPKLFKQTFDPYMEENLISELDNIDLASTEIVDGPMAEFSVLGFISKKGLVAAVAGSGSLVDTTTGITVTFPTNGALVTLSASSHNSAGTKSVGKLGDTVMINGVQGRVKAKNTATSGAHRFLLEPVTQTAYAPASDPYSSFFSGLINRPAYTQPTLSTAITVGAEIMFLGSSYSDGYNSAIDGDSRIPNVFNTYAQIIRTPYNIDATTGATLLEYGGYQITKGMIDVMVSHQLEIAASVYFQTPGTNLNENGETVQNMDSIQSNIRAFGLRYEQTAGSHTLSDLNAVEAYQQKERGAKDFMVRAGLGWVQNHNTLMANFTEKGGIVYNKELIDMNYKGLALARSTFYIKVDQMFAHKNFGYTIGNNYDNRAFVLPYQKVRDPKSNEDGYAMSLAFLKDPKYGIRKYKSVEIGFGAGNSRKDAMTYELMSHPMLKFLGAGQAVEMYS